MNARRGAFGVIATSEICVREQIGLSIIDVLAYPSDLPAVQSRMDVAHKTVKLTITIRVPLCNVTGECTHCTKQVKTSHASPVQHFHQYAGRTLSQMPSDKLGIRGTLGTTGPSFIRVVPATPCAKSRGLKATATPRAFLPFATATRGTRPGVDEVIYEWRRNMFQLELRTCKLCVYLSTYEAKNSSMS